MKKVNKIKSVFRLLRQKIVSHVFLGRDNQEDDKRIDDLIALGVLLWLVAESDNKFLPQEKDQIELILRQYAKISAQDMPIVLRAIEEASLNKVNLSSITKEISKNINCAIRQNIIENLFRVAMIDRGLNEKEYNTIKKIACTFKMDSKKFMESQSKIETEFGIQVKI